MNATKLKYARLTLAAGALTLGASAAHADQVILDDLIVDGSACIGFDCVNGESFGFDTIRIKENNLRIKAQDTSSTASFPSNDWQLTFNDSSNGGANKFSVDDITGGRTPFTIEAGARTNALYVDDSGRIGIGTATPVVNLHVKTGNTPTLRLEQDGSSGFTPQTWDVAGNEANFFVRDATNGSTLPFRIFPGAPSNALNIEASTGDVGLGTTSPEAALHIKTSTGGGAASLTMENNGGSFITMENSTTARSWFLTHENAAAGRFIIGRDDSGTNSMFLGFDGSLRVGGNGTAGNGFNMDADGNIAIGGALTQNSDKNSKMAIEPVDADDILAKVTALPVSAWTYNTDADAGIRHIGPMAQDFYALFGTGATETGLSSIDSSGVALAAIQALVAQNDAQRALNAELLLRLDTLEGQAAE